MRTVRQPNWLRAERSVATLEFAMVLPILLLVLFGILEFGRIMTVSHVLTAAARDGARIAVLPGADNSQVLAAVNNQLSQAGISYDSYEFTPSDVSTASRDDPVTIRISINYESIAWVPGFIPGLSGVQLQGVAVMRKEGFS